jgi:RecJ-like exonuclease
MKKNSKLVEKKERCPVCNGHAIKSGLNADKDYKLVTNCGESFLVCSRCNGTGKITKYSVRSTNRD